MHTYHNAILANLSSISRPLGNERVHLPLYEVADTPFDFQRDDYNRLS